MSSAVSPGGTPALERGDSANPSIAHGEKDCKKIREGSIKKRAAESAARRLLKRGNFQPRYRSPIGVRASLPVIVVVVYVSASTRVP
jgi:hypothetical protein